MKLREAVEQERFHSRRHIQESASRPLEWDTLKTIEVRLQDMLDDIVDLMPFNSQERMLEIHGINETLIKIRAGRFDSVIDCVVD